MSSAFLNKKHSSMPGHTVWHQAFAPRGPKRLKFQAGLTWIILLSILVPSWNIIRNASAGGPGEDRGGSPRPGKGSLRKQTCLGGVGGGRGGGQVPAHLLLSVPRGGALGSVQPGDHYGRWAGRCQDWTWTSLLSWTAEKVALVSSVVHLPVTFKSLVWPCDLHWSLASFRRDSDKPSNLDMVSVLIRLQPQQRHSLGLAEPTMFGRPCLNRRLLVTARVCSPRLCGADQQHLGVLKGSSCLTLGNELCPNRDH